MFSNFKDAFIKKPQYTSEPPQAVLDTISKDLPEGFYYVHDHDGLCRIETPSGFNLQSGKIQLSEKAKKIISESSTMDDILTYAYNSQTDIIFMPDEDGYFMVNGNKIKADDMVKAPMRNIHLEKAQFILRPQPFPEPFKLKIGCSDQEIELKVRRIANNSLNIQEYESTTETPISIRYKVELIVPARFIFTININVEKAKNASEIAQAYHIYNAFMEGEGMIAGSKLVYDKPLSANKISEDTVEFWDKLVAIEKYLNLQFNVSNGITVSDAKSIEEMYRCFIEKKPYKNYKIYNSVKGFGKFEQFEERLGNNSEVYFEYTAEGKMELLGEKIEIIGLFGIFGAMVDKKVVPVSGATGDFEIFLTTAPQKRMYEAVMLFKTEEQLKMFKELPDHIKIMENATEVNSIE